ncbi:MAG: radical SAM protein [Candidatus Aminicenantes bacterium]|nr:radical SAM protein [Candidatus Aminicenantes bacterium]
MKDITLVNMNMLFIRHFDHIEREIHLPLGPLYLISALEQAGLSVDFRDYQLGDYEDPFRPESILDFFKEPAAMIGVSVMTNLLPFAILALQSLKERYPDRPIILGGVGPKSVERQIMERFPWIDVIAMGEGEISAPGLVAALRQKRELSNIPGIAYRRHGEILVNPRPPRIRELDSIRFPAFHRIDLKRYAGYGILTSRGCPYECTFCSVAPIWDRISYSRSAENIIQEMRFVHEKSGADLFLFQDEFFVSSKRRVLDFCRELKKSGLPVQWKTFGRVDLTDEETMAEMADAGCIEIRYGIESGSAKILERTKKGFTPDEAVKVISQAVRHFPRVDTFFVWGFPFETMEDFHQSLFQMINFRAMGARVLPSLLCFLPQTAIYNEYKDQRGFTFCSDLLPEYMITGHETFRGSRMEIGDRHRPIFDFIKENIDIFPGFFHYRPEENVIPKLKILQEFGFYPSGTAQGDETESCGAHSPKTTAQFRGDADMPSRAAAATRRRWPGTGSR